MADKKLETIQIDTEFNKLNILMKHNFPIMCKLCFTFNSPCQQFNNIKNKLILTSQCHILGLNEDSPFFIHAYTLYMYKGNIVLIVLKNY